MVVVRPRAFKPKWLKSAADYLRAAIVRLVNFVTLNTSGRTGPRAVNVMQKYSINMELVTATTKTCPCQRQYLAANTETTEPRKPMMATAGLRPGPMSAIKFSEKKRIFKEKCILLSGAALNIFSISARRRLCALSLLMQKIDCRGGGPHIGPMEITQKATCCQSASAD